MRVRVATLAGVVVAFAVSSAPALWAADEAKLPWTFDGSISAGYRMVDIDGSKDRYKEDVNLRSGGRLFGFELNGLARHPESSPLDRFSLLIDGPHDEPVSHYRLTAADDRVWDLRADFVRSKYFYAVPQLWEQPVAGNSRLDDLHDFDLNRTNGAVDFTLHLPSLPTLRLGYRLYERHGDTVTTTPVPGGDTALVRLPVDSVAHVGSVGTDFHALGTDVSVTQAYRRLDRALDRRGPLSAADALGLDPTDGITLRQFDSRQDEHLDMPTTTVRVRRPFGDAVDVSGAYYFAHGDLESARVRQRDVAGGPLPGADLTVDRSHAALDAHVLDLGGTWRANDLATFHLTYRLNDRSQNGTLDSRGLGGFVGVVTSHHVRVHRVSGDVALQPRPDLRLLAGVTWARRDTRFTLTDQRIATDTISALGDATWTPRSWFEGWVRYRNEQIDDPLVATGDALGAPPLPAREIALTFSNRGTTGVRLRPWAWLSVRYELIAESRENDTFHARSQSFGNSVLVTATPKPDLLASVGYTRRDVDSRADILLAPRAVPVRSLQRGVENVATGELDWGFRLLGQRWTATAAVTYVDAADVIGPRLEGDALGTSFFDLDRVDGSASLTLHHPWIEPSVEFRMVDYNERVLPRNDYRATIVALRLTKRFAF